MKPVLVKRKGNITDYSVICKVYSVKNMLYRIFFTRLFVPQAPQIAFYRRDESDIQLAIPLTHCVCGMEIDMEDSSIIELFFERSEYAIKETKIKYGHLIQSIALRILHNHPDAEECENDTYMGAWNSIPPNRPGNLKAYIAKIARNQALKKYQFQHADKRNPEIILSLNELEEQLADCGEKSSNAQFEDTEMAEVINSFLAGLNSRTRRIFMLRYWYFLSVTEIMEECGMSRSKVESILYRTRQKLKQYMEEF